ncbi:MAG: MMPL family transporter [Chromatiales bacterium]|nr:MMPL family transporter [Chromatiales bacterium]
MSESSASGAAAPASLPVRYARWAIRFRKLIILLVVLVTLAAATQVPKLDIRNDPDTLLPPTNRYVATNLYAEHNYGMGNLMVFALRVKDGDIYQPWLINMLQDLHRKLEALPTSRPENFIDIAAQKIKYMSADENGLVFKRLIPTAGIDTENPEKAAEQLAFLREGIESNPVMAPMLVSYMRPDGTRCQFLEYDNFDTSDNDPNCTAKAAYVIADYTDDVKQIYLPWVDEVHALAQEYAKDPRVEVRVAGEPYFLAWMLRDLVNKWWLFAISVGIVIAVLWFEFRNLKAAIFPLLGVGATITMTLGLMGFTQFKLTTMMVLTPMLLLAIGIGHSVQITRRAFVEMDKNPDCECADMAETAVSQTIVPATLSIVTDMAGFATLALVDISFYKDYAYFGMFGMATLLITTTTLIPLLLMTFPFKKRELSTSHGWEQAVGGFLAKLTTGPGKILPLAFVAVVIGLSVYYTKIYQATSDNLMPGVERGINYARAAFKESSETIQDLLQLNRIMPGVISVSIPIRGREKTFDICSDQPFPESLYDIENRAERLAQCEKYKAELQCWDPDPCGAQGVFNDADVLGDVEKLENWMRAHPYIGFTGSYAQYIRLVNMLLAAEPGEKPQLRDLAIPTLEHLRKLNPDDDRSPDGITELYNGLLEAMTSPGDMDSFVAKNWNEGAVMGFINTMDPVQTHQVTMDIQQYIEDHKNDPGFSKVHFGLRSGPADDLSGDTNELSVDGPNYVRPAVGGFLGATEATREVAEQEWLRSPLQTALAVFIISALMFRSFSVAIILISLLFVTLFAQYGLGGYFTSVENWSGNLAFHLLVTLSISMGLGVDYSIYMVSRLREEMIATGNDWDKSLQNTLNTTGSAVLVSVVVLLGSFIPLVSTSLANTWGLGVFIGEALIIDVVTALAILPLLVRWIKPAYVFKAT